jgi:protein dithiol oxidoreductase (disulfide-forming)
MTRALISALAAMLALAACGKEPTTSATPAAPDAQPAQTEPVPQQAAEPPAPVDQLKQPAGSADGESVDEAAITTTAVAAAVAANTPAPPAGDLKGWKAGTNFTEYPVAQRISTPPGQVEVTEAFWYGCAHCYSLEPQLVAWEKTKPDWVKLRRMPVVWNDVTREDARLYFTLEGLGLVEKLHSEIFRQIHARNRPFTVIRGNAVDLAATEKAARDFFVANGVSAEDFAKHYRTFSTENKLRQAATLTRDYAFVHTPMIAVQGKYQTDLTSAGGPEALFRLINDLAARERPAG